MLSVSILGIKEDKINNYIKLDNTNADFIHIDIMDNIFVPNASEYNENYVFNKPIDIHLMVEDTKTYIDEFLAFEPCYITVHKEALKNIEDLEKTIQYVKEQGVKIGVAIRPETKIEEIHPILEYIHLLLVMTVEPGRGRTRANKKYN